MVTVQRSVLTQPILQVTKSEISGLIEVEKKSVGVGVSKTQPISVNSQEGRCHRDSNSLVAIDKRMILRKTFP